MAEVGPLMSPVLVGRDDVLTGAYRHVAAAAEGHGGLLLLAGEPGIGKSRLLNSVIQEARAGGFRVAKGDLGPHDELVSLAAVHDLARAMNKGGFGRLGADLLNAGGAGGQDALGTRRNIVRELVDMIIEAIDQPTVLAFDDLQWADEMTLEVIGELARKAPDWPLLLLGAYRLDELPTGSIHREWRARLLTQRSGEELKVGRLTHDETALVTTLLLGTGLPAPREVVDAVYQRTNGIPLHIEELLAAVGGGATDGRAILGAAVPDTIEDAVRAHAAHLSEDARSVALAGSVLGRCFTPAVLAGILDRPRAELDEPLEELVNGGILFPFEQVDQGYFDFRHQLLRDALYATIPARDIRRFHARAGEFGASLVAASEIHASYHFERAGMGEQAFRAALGAAQEASRMSSHREAFDLYRRAIANMPAELPEADKAAIWLAYADAAAALDRNDISRAAAERGRELALGASDGLRAAVALATLCMVARRQGEPLVDRRDQARRLSLELDRLPSSQSAARLRVQSLWYLGQLEVDALNLKDARGLFVDAREYALAHDLSDDARECDVSLAQLDVIEGHVDVGLAVMHETADAARVDRAETLAVGAYRDLAYFAARSLDYRQAALRLADGLRYADEVEQSYCGHMLASTKAIVSWADGQWGTGAEQGGQALSDPGSNRARAMAQWALGYIAAGRGDRAAAEAQLAPAIEFGRHAGWLEMTLPPQWGMAEAALMAGDASTAIAYCEDALTTARQRGELGLLAPFVVTGVRAYEAAGRPDAAEKWLGQVVRAIGPLGDVAAPGIRHGTGLVSLAHGSVAAARDALADAARLWDERGRRWEALWARLDLAAADLRANRYGEAMALVREVRDAAEPMGSEPLLARADHLTELAKGRGAELEPWHPLTVREFEVARRVSEGLTNVEIGQELFISPKTAGSHIEHIMAKLGVTRRAEIATWVATVNADARRSPTHDSRVASPT